MGKNNPQNCNDLLNDQSKSFDLQHSLSVYRLQKPENEYQIRIKLGQADKHKIATLKMRVNDLYMEFMLIFGNFHQNLSMLQKLLPQMF